jgi:hypothetical protein
MKKDQEKPVHSSWLQVVDDVRTICAQLDGVAYIPILGDESHELLEIVTT